MTTNTAQEIRPTVAACYCGSFWCLDPEHLTPELRAEPRRIANDAALTLIASGPRVAANDAALDLIAGARRRASHRRIA